MKTPITINCDEIIKEQNRRQNVALQIEVKKALITLWNARIVSGAYKQANLFHGISTDNTPFTDDEKLKHDIDILQRHVKDLMELSDSIML